MKIEYHLYEIPRYESNEIRLSELGGENEENWILIDKSDKENISIRSKKNIDDLLTEKGIKYKYCGLESCEKRDVPILS